MSSRSLQQPPQRGDSYVLQSEEADGLMRDDLPSSARATRGGGRRDGRTPSSSRDTEDSDYDDDEDYEMSISELLYSSSSYYAIAKPVTLTMILAALSVCWINTEETRAQGEAAMAAAYQVWNVDAQSAGSTLAISLANALVMVSAICAMTFVVVILYRFKFMKCLIGYMVVTSGILLGILGGNLAQTAISIYNTPVDYLTFYFVMFNFAFVGVIAVFWGHGIPKVVTQGYLICTSVILAWHLSYFDDWTTWTLLFMLAIYDLCAVLTPCGPLKALVNLMSKDDAPDMPGLLFEADLPPEAKRPRTGSSTRNGTAARGQSTTTPGNSQGNADPLDPNADPAHRNIKIPLAIAKVYLLPVVNIPPESLKVMFPNRPSASNVSAAPLLAQDDELLANANLPETPTPQQLRADVVVRLPPNGGRIEHVTRRGRKVYLERDRHGHPKRILWVDSKGKVFAEMKSDDEEGPERNSIRLGLGDFIFYSVLVAKAAQYSFCTFAACVLVILAGLGWTLVLLSVYGHALPALPISIFLGVVFYLTTRLCMEPWIEAVMSQPFYV
jgi:presenilin 1